MKALLYTPSLPRFFAARVLGKRFPTELLPLKLVDYPLPERPGFLRVKVRLSGVCGSDLGLLYGKNSPFLAPFFSFPAVLGHEILGEVGGTRVVVNPLLACKDRGLPPCARCREGEEGLCENLAEGDLSPGILGFNRDLPGGWGEYTLARPERLFPVPDGVPDARAVLAEPLAVVLRGLGKLRPWPREVLIVGMGTIGLLAVRALRLLGYGGRIYALAKYPRQAELARAFGAEGVEAPQAKGRAYKAYGFTAYRGGYEAVIEASGSGKGFRQALAWVQEGGRVLLLGAPGVEVVDLSPLWFREVKLLGSYTYREEEFKGAVELLKEAEGLEDLIGGIFPLEGWKEALAARGKALLRP